MGIGIGGSVGPFFASAHLRGRDAGPLAQLFVILMGIMVALAAIGIVVLWPYALGRALAIAIGVHAAAVPVGIVFEVIYALGILAFLGRRGAARASSDRFERLHALETEAEEVEKAASAFQRLADSYNADPVGSVAQTAGLKPGERLLGVVEQLSLMEMRVDATRGVKELTAVETGRLVVSDKALRFIGPRGHREWTFSTIYQHTAGRNSLQMWTTTRANVSGVGGSPEAVSQAYALFLWGAEINNVQASDLEQFLAHEAQRFFVRLRRIQDSYQHLASTSPARRAEPRA